MERNQANAGKHFLAARFAIWTALGLWSCCGPPLPMPHLASTDSFPRSAPTRWVGNFFQDDHYEIYAVRITPTLLPDRINEDVTIALGITSYELVRLLGPPHQVLIDKDRDGGFSFVYFTTVDCYSFFFTRAHGNKAVLYGIDAVGGY